MFLLCLVPLCAHAQLPNLQKFLDNYSAEQTHAAEDFIHQIESVYLDHAAKIDQEVTNTGGHVLLAQQALDAAKKKQNELDIKEYQVENDLQDWNKDLVAKEEEIRNKLAEIESAHNSGLGIDGEAIINKLESDLTALNRDKSKIKSTIETKEGLLKNLRQDIASTEKSIKTTASELEDAKQLLQEWKQYAADLKQAATGAIDECSAFFKGLYAIGKEATYAADAAKASSRLEELEQLVTKGRLIGSITSLAKNIFSLENIFAPTLEDSGLNHLLDFLKIHPEYAGDPVAAVQAVETPEELARNKGKEKNIYTDFIATLHPDWKQTIKNNLDKQLTAREAAMKDPTLAALRNQPVTNPNLPYKCQKDALNTSTNDAGIHPNMSVNSGSVMKFPSQLPSWLSGDDAASQTQQQK